MKKGKIIKTVFLVSVIIIIILVIAQLWIRYGDYPYITDYRGKFVNSAGEKFKAEIIESRKKPYFNYLEIRKDESRDITLFDLNYKKPKEALPQDVRFIDIDTEINSYIVWIYQKDGSEIIKHSYLPRMLFYLDSDIIDLDMLDIYCINDIEESNVLDKLPDADIHKAKWENYFSRLKQEYEESNNTSSKEDSV